MAALQRDEMASAMDSMASRLPFGLSQRQVLIGGAVLALAFFFFRSRQDESQKAARRLVRDWRDVDSVDDGREYLQSSVVPILRPALLAILDELETAVMRALQRVERSVKRL